MEKAGQSKIADSRFASPRNPFELGIVVKPSEEGLDGLSWIPLQRKADDARQTVLVSEDFLSRRPDGTVLLYDPRPLRPPT
jgi:hypothetical protein